MTNKKTVMYDRIREHGEKLNAIFNTGIEPIALCKKLRRLEARAHKLATDYCNGKNGVNTENWDNLCEPILQQVEKILNVNRKHAGLFINGDARGYALKIDDSYVKEHNLNICKDWGGYGIIAPDFTNN